MSDTEIKELKKKGKLLLQLNENYHNFLYLNHIDSIENEKQRLESKIIENKRILENKHRDDYNKLVDKDKEIERLLKIKNYDFDELKKLSEKNYSELREKYNTLKQVNGESTKILM